MSSIWPLTPTEFFQHGTDFATQAQEQEQKFGYWFKNMIYQACGDLFDHQGAIKENLMRAEKINSLSHVEDRAGVF